MTGFFEKQVKEIETGLLDPEDTSDSQEIVEWHLESGPVQASQEAYQKTASYLAQVENPQIGEVVQDVDVEEGGVIEALYQLSNDSDVPVSIEQPSTISELDTADSADFKPEQYAEMTQGTETASYMEWASKGTRDGPNPLESMKEGY